MSPPLPPPWSEVPHLPPVIWQHSPNLLAHQPAGLNKRQSFPKQHPEPAFESDHSLAFKSRHVNTHQLQQVRAPPLSSLLSLLGTPCSSHSHLSIPRTCHATPVFVSTHGWNILFLEIATVNSLASKPCSHITLPVVPTLMCFYNSVSFLFCESLPSRGSEQEHDKGWLSERMDNVCYERLWNFG